jgi:hypothetical protein
VNPYLAAERPVSGLAAAVGLGLAGGTTALVWGTR